MLRQTQHKEEKMKKLLFTTALLSAGIAFSTFSHAGEIADRVEKTKT